MKIEYRQAKKSAHIIDFKNYLNKLAVSSEVKKIVMIANACIALLTQQQHSFLKKQNLTGLRQIMFINSNQQLVRVLENFSIY